jgi:LPXTG-site transpeptidase (sortase) family protein
VKRTFYAKAEMSPAEYVDEAYDAEPEETGAAARERKWLNWRTAAAAAAALPVLFIGGLDWSNGPKAQAGQGTGQIGAQEADPVRVRLARLKIDAKMDPLYVDEVTQELQPPNYGRAGWYKAGPEPGELGRAVIAAHLDNKTGHDVFWPLKKAHKGDTIVVDTAAGKTLTFVVQAVEVHKRSAFPTSRVYGGPRQVSELRLITCGGQYDKANGGYQSNVVVFAKAV